MSSYSPQDLSGGWEFKILRSSSSTREFRKPEKLRAALEQEARAGWELVEKFDDSRLRLKRLTSHRRLDEKLGFDPYRTQLGMSEGALAAIIAISALAIGLAVVIVAMLLTTKPSSPVIPKVDRPISAPAAPALPIDSGGELR